MKTELTKKLISALKASDHKTSGYDTSATVKRIENGIAWVHIPGGVDETPVKLTINASVGDNVQVRVSGGRAFLVGNGSAPPTDDTTANKANATAKKAHRTALQASEEATEAWNYAGTAAQAAVSAQTSADSAAEAASNAWEHADEAHQAATEARASAISANNSANNALVQLSVVEDVAGTLRWISEHGEYVQTTDTTIQEGTVYFVYQYGDYIPIASPDPSANPSEEGWYVLDVTESQSKYIMSHLAVTSAGLWVLPVDQLAPHPLVDSDDNQIIDSDDNPLVDFSKDPQNATGYKVLISGGERIGEVTFPIGLSIYNDEGALIANYGETTTIGAETGYNTHIDSNGFYVRDGLTPLAMYGSTTLFYEPDGQTIAAEIGSNGLDIKYGKIGNFTLNATGIRGTEPTTGKVIVMKPSEWAFAAGGNTHQTYAGCPFRVSIDGALYSESGQIGGWTIDGNKLNRADGSGNTVNLVSTGLDITANTPYGSQQLISQTRVLQNGISLKHYGNDYMSEGTLTSRGLLFDSSDSVTFMTLYGGLNATPYVRVGERIGSENHYTYKYLQLYFNLDSGASGLRWVETGEGVSTIDYAPFWVSGGNDVVIEGWTEIDLLLRTHYQNSSQEVARIVFCENQDDNLVFRPEGNNKIYLGTSLNKWKGIYGVAIRGDDVYGNLHDTSSSDLKDKNVLKNHDWKIDDFIQGLKPIAFKWKEGSTGRIHMGFGAQDVAKLSKDLGIGDLSVYSAEVKTGGEFNEPYHGEEIDDSKLSWTMTYTELIAPMVLEIQRLMNRVKELEDKLNG